MSQSVEIERDWYEEQMDRSLKVRVGNLEKRVVFLEEKKTECTTEKGKEILGVEINGVLSESLRFSEEYFQRTGMRLSPLPAWQLATKKMQKAGRAESAAKRAKLDALVDATATMSM
jgi:hypothetical protein